MNILRRMFNILSWPVYLCIAGYLLIAAPILAGYRPVVVLSGSMEPAFPVGSVIYYKKASFEQIQEGDSITFHAGEDGSLVTHRVVEKQELSRDFITKGDANETADPVPVSYDRVAGRTADMCIPYAGYFVAYGRKPQIIGVLGGILLLGILFDLICPGKD